MKPLKKEEELKYSCYTKSRCKELTRHTHVHIYAYEGILGGLREGGGSKALPPSDDSLDACISRQIVQPLVPKITPSIKQRVKTINKQVSILS